MNVLDEFKNYKRKFIQISPRTAILLHIFSKDSDDFEDIVLLDNEGYREKSYCTKIYKDAADQFFKQYITKYYNLLQEYKTTYDNFILGLENESNSNQ